MIRILVTNIKGGCGKTTIATNIAGAFACAGFGTALADVDRQRSSLDWLSIRGRDAAHIEGLDWRKGTLDPPKSVTRLVIDAPANLRMKQVEDLIREADIVVVPVLPSLFDEGSTRRFLGKLEELKPIRKGKKNVALVANRVRPRSRATQRLDTFLQEIEEAPVARLSDRAIYGEVAVQGLSVFDVGGRMPDALQEEWRPLIRTVDDPAIG